MNNSTSVRERKLFSQLGRGKPFTIQHSTPYNTTLSAPNAMTAKNIPRRRRKTVGKVGMVLQLLQLRNCREKQPAMYRCSPLPRAASLLLVGGVITAIEERSTPRRWVEVCPETATTIRTHRSTTLPERSVQADVRGKRRQHAPHMAHKNGCSCGVHPCRAHRSNTTQLGIGLATHRTRRNHRTNVRALCAV